MLRKGGSNWVEGDRFFNREVELEALEERVRDGIHTLITAQRRMGKTSVVRELLRRLADGGEFETVFVDLEAAADPADAVAEISVQARAVHGTIHRVKSSFAHLFKAVGGQIEELSLADLKVRLRAGINAGNWRQKGNATFTYLAKSRKPVVLAIDEIPILINRLLRGGADRITPEGKRAADEFLSWLRRNGQAHRGRISMILTGSIGLQPILQQAGLSAHANIFSAYDLKPWSTKTAVSCLMELAESNEIDLPAEICEYMCQRLRCCIPHHVQMFFDKLHDHLRRAERQKASREDAEWVYLHEMLGVRGQVDLHHYESRLETILGRDGYPIALEILTETAVKGHLDGDTVDRYREYVLTRDVGGAPSVEDVFHVLSHDGYLSQKHDGYGFVSGYLEDWWRSRYSRTYLSVLESVTDLGRKEQ